MFKKLSKRIHLSIRSKIVLPYLLLAVSIAIGAAYVVSGIVFESVEERFLNQLIEVGKISTEGIVREENRLLNSLRLLARTEGIAASIRSGESDELRLQTLPIVVNAQEEIVAILDRDGESALAMHHIAGGSVQDYEYSLGSFEFQDYAIVQKVLAGESDEKGDKFSGFYLAPGGYYFFVAGPIYGSNNQVAGVALVGESLATLAQKIREETLAQITLYAADGSLLASTFLYPVALDEEMATKVPDQSATSSPIRSLNVADIAYSEILGVWRTRTDTDLGLIGVSFARNFIVRMSQSTWLGVILLLGSALSLVSAVGFLVSNVISKPIRQLEHAASQVAGGDLSIQVEAESGDELAALAQEFNVMIEKVQESRDDLVAAYDTTLEGWAKALELRDQETEGHCKRVVELTIKIARMMAIVGEEEITNIRRGAFLHDIGKMATPDRILFKPGPLTKDERKVIERHPVQAYEILKDIEFLKPALNIPYCHHEHWDGSGYPRGLKGEAIPLAARIFAVVDTWDAMRTDRPYRKALTIVAVLDHIQSNQGKLYDPKVVTTFMEFLGRAIEGNIGNVS